MTVAKYNTELETNKGMTVFNKNKVDTKKQPMFFGQPLGVQRYDSYKYPVFDKRTRKRNVETNTFKDVNICYCPVKFTF